ncbi:MAG: histidine kinase [Ilumatobacteraceae bacterium]|nr:histidine kinase [Ilumatobacteraceae bacterium]
MRRRLTRAILLVTGLTLLILGIPLAVVVSRYYENSATVDLQRRAAEATAEVTLPFDASVLQDLGDEGVSEMFGVYDATGARVAGTGPARADRATMTALTGDPSFDHSGELLVYAAPVNERGTDAVAGAVRVAERDAHIDARIHRAWLIMAIAGLIALIIAWVVAAAQARRLARPITELAASAERLGAGGVVLGHDPTGVGELDLLGDTLASSSVQLAELIARERAFTADVSHQLRTPLTGLRLLIEAEVPEAQVRSELLDEVNRLQSTVEHLLALTRDQLPAASAHALGDVVADAQRRWSPRLAAAGRSLDVSIDPHIDAVHGSATALAQILDVLIDNAATHGRGVISLVARSAPGGAALEVTDEGEGIAAPEMGKIFERHHGAGSGIGLALARSLAEADGGRLLLTQLRPPRFSVLFPTSHVDAGVLPGPAPPHDDGVQADASSAADHRVFGAHRTARR